MDEWLIMDQNSERRMEMSEDSFWQIIGLAQMSGKWTFPTVKYNQDKYLLSREELGKKGYIQEDFDGLLHPTRQLAGVLNVFKNATGALHCEKKDGEFYLIKCYVDSVMMEKKGNHWEMERISLVDSYSIIENLKQEKPENLIKITSQRTEKESDSEEGLFYQTNVSEKLEIEIDRHQYVFWHPVD